MKIFKPFDIIIVLIALSVSFFLIIKPFSVEEGKKIVLVVDNNKHILPWKNGRISLKEQYNKDILIEINDDRVRVLESSCPDKICVNEGWISQCGQSAACLPNKTAVIIQCDDYTLSGESK